MSQVVETRAGTETRYSALDLLINDYLYTELGVKERLAAVENPLREQDIKRLSPEKRRDILKVIIDEGKVDEVFNHPKVPFSLLHDLLRLLDELGKSEIIITIKKDPNRESSPEDNHKVPAETETQESLPVSSQELSDYIKDSETNIKIRYRADRLLLFLDTRKHQYAEEIAAIEKEYQEEKNRDSSEKNTFMSRVRRRLLGQKLPVRKDEQTLLREKEEKIRKVQENLQFSLRFMTRERGLRERLTRYILLPLQTEPTIRKRKSEVSSFSNGKLHEYTVPPTPMSQVIWEDILERSRRRPKAN